VIILEHPPKIHDLHHWSEMCVDLFGPWSIQTTEKETPISLLALTIIDPDTSWFVVTPLPGKQSETVAVEFDQN